MADRVALHYLQKRDAFFPAPERNTPERLLFRVAHEIWAAGSEYAVNSQNVITLLQVKAGDACFCLNGAEGRVGGKELLCYGLNASFSIAVRKDLELRILCLLPHALAQVQECGAAPGVRRSLGSAAKPCWKVMGDILACAQGGNSLKQRICESLTRVWLDWCVSTCGEAVTPDEAYDPAGRACAYIRTHLDRLRSIGELADACRCSPEHLSRVFLERFQESPWQYVRRRQINLAAQILRDTGESVEAVAHRFGYSDRYSFSRAFRQYCGIAPGRYRKGG